MSPPIHESLRILGVATATLIFSSPRYVQHSGAMLDVTEKVKITGTVERTTLKPGEKVTVTVRPLRDGTPGGQCVSIVPAGGQTLGGEQSC